MHKLGLGRLTGGARDAEQDARAVLGVVSLPSVVA